MIRLTELKVQGYRALADFHAKLGPLTAIVGPNASGKSTVLEVLELASEAVKEGTVGDAIARRGGSDSVLWRGGHGWGFQMYLSLECDDRGPHAAMVYQFTVGRDEHTSELRVRTESLIHTPRTQGQTARIELVDFTLGRGLVRSIHTGRESSPPGELPPDQLALSRFRDPVDFQEHDQVRECISSWRFYPPFDVGSGTRIRQAYRLGSDATRDEQLAADGRNLAGVLSRLRSTASFGDNFAELEEMCRVGFAEFKSVGTRRSPSGIEEVVEWVEQAAGHEEEAFLAWDLSDGILRFLCLAVLCMSPNPPRLVGIDEPELGLHPRLLPIVAAMLRGLSERTQVIVLTHSPELLNGFELDEIAVMSKDETGAHLHRPADSKVLRALLEPTVGETIGGLFTSGELEFPPEPAEAASAAGERNE